jgi:hypothetical protein
MATAEPVERWTQLATRIPKGLHHRIKVYCVTHDTMLQHFVAEAIREKLGRRSKKGTAQDSSGMGAIRVRT